MTNHRLEIRVYYEDTDFSGLVYHASYLRFLERGRTEWLRQRGVLHHELLSSPERKTFAVRAMEIDFLKPADMDDLLIVETELTEVGGAWAMFRQTIWRDQETLVQAKAKIVAIRNRRAARLPQIFHNGGALPPCQTGEPLV